MPPCCVSSRRRHTSSYGDWSSDVCSSDLFYETMFSQGSGQRQGKHRFVKPVTWTVRDHLCTIERRVQIRTIVCRSEERRVGKERRSWGTRDYVKQKYSEHPGVRTFAY